MDNVFWLVFVGFLIFLAYRVLKYKGLKGAAFGAEILNTVGAVQGQGRGLAGLAVKVHSLKPETPSQPLVGIEIVARSIASYEMMPIVLSASDAQQLISFLEKAISAKHI